MAKNMLIWTVGEKEISPVTQ